MSEDGDHQPETQMPDSGWLKLAFGVICGLLGAGLILLVSSPPRGKSVELMPTLTPAPILVHVNGAVAQPGVYSLEAGSRVQDAIMAAGGLLDAADTRALNLAAILQDGERVFVGTIPTPAPTPNGTSEYNRGAQLEPNFPININSASQAELELLPGIGPVTARKIIDYRQAHGPFTSIEQIQEVSGIGPKTFAEIKDLITV